MRLVQHVILTCNNKYGNIMLKIPLPSVFLSLGCIRLVFENLYNVTFIVN